MVSKNFNSLENRDLKSRCHQPKTNGQKQQTRNKGPNTRNQTPETSNRPLRRSPQPETRNRPFIIPIFLPHAGGPHQCIFCNQISITGIKKRTISTEKLHSHIEEFLKYKAKQRKPVQIAFFGGNFLGMNADDIALLLAEAAGFVEQGVVDSIRFSTRPDTIDRKSLDLIKNFPVSTVELGVQSMDNEVLALAKRGHTRADTQKAVYLLKDRNYEIGLQIMVGLPGDNQAKTFNTGHRIINLAPDFVRIYPTVVLAGSPLARWYQTGKYVPLSLQECVNQVKHLYVLFKQNTIRVIRMGLQASQDLAEGSTVLAGPYHPAFGHLVHCALFLDRAVSALKSKAVLGNHVIIRVHPKNISKMRGLKNGNISKLKQQFHLKSVNIIPDSAFGENELSVIAPA
jgi:histone acetyltransferase (RNA polymerase elongator complex component)